MKSLIPTLLIILFSLSSASGEDSDDLIIDCDYYTRWVGAEKAPASKPLGYYIDSAHTLSEPFRKYYLEQKSRYKDFDDSLLIEVDTIGLILNHAIVDIMLEVSPGARLPGDFQDEIGKMVLIETDPGLFKVLYAALTSPGAYDPERTVIEDYNSYKIVYTKSRYSGQFTWYTQDYWVYNVEDKCFTRLDYYTSIKDTVKALMPDSCSGSRSTFVTDSLFWYNYLKTEGDHYHWPTCGRIKIWFELQHCSLVPVKIIYDPDDKAPH